MNPTATIPETPVSVITKTNPCKPQTRRRSPNPGGDQKLLVYLIFFLYLHYKLIAYTDPDLL